MVFKLLNHFYKQPTKKGLCLSEKNQCLPSSFEGWLWHVCCRDHLLSWPHPHDGPIITLGPTLESKAGKCTPGQSHLEVRRISHVKGNFLDYLQVKPSHPKEGFRKLILCVYKKKNNVVLDSNLYVKKNQWS